MALHKSPTRTSAIGNATGTTYGLTGLAVGTVGSSTAWMRARFPVEARSARTWYSLVFCLF